MNHISYQIFKYIIKKHETVSPNLSIRIYVKKIKNKVIFEIKTGYYFELLTHQTIKLVENITKIKKGENVPHLEITEVILIHCDKVNDDYQHD